MKTKSTFLARNALASPTFVARQPRWRRVATVRACQCPPMAAISTQQAGHRVDAGQYLVVRIYEGPLIARAETNWTATGEISQPVGEVAS